MGARNRPKIDAVRKFIGICYRTILKKIEDFPYLGDAVYGGTC